MNELDLGSLSTQDRNPTKVTLRKPVSNGPRVVFLSRTRLTSQSILGCGLLSTRQRDRPNPCVHAGERGEQ